jgi:hypothetical protein
MAGLENFINRGVIFDYTIGGKKSAKQITLNRSFQDFSSSSRNPSPDTITNTVQTIKPASKKGPTESFRVLIIILTVGSICLVAGIVTFCVLYFGVMIKTPTYKDACSTTNLCASNTDLECEITCKCSSNKYWDGYKCADQLTLGSTCYGGSFQCQIGLSCINTLCQCSNSKYYTNGNCTQKKAYNTSCTSCSYTTCPSCLECSQCEDYLNLYCDSISLKCVCPVSTHYLDSFTGLCKPKGSYNYYCEQDSWCQVQALGLFCQTSSSGSSCPMMPQPNYCNCPNGTYWNGTICKTLELYYSTCTSNCTCDGSKLLYCDTLDYRCICSPNYYWDSSFLNCTSQLYQGMTCTSSKQCLVSKGNK